MEAPSNAPPFGAGRGVTPGSLENLGAHYYMGNTKIATMFASHAASGKRRWAALGHGRAGAMTVIWAQIVKTASRVVGESSLMCTW